MSNITELTAKLKAECKASRLWERLDDAARDNAQQMRNIALESLVALDKAEILNADLREALEAAEQRIAELEARTLTVKLPDYRGSYKEAFASEVEHHVRIELGKLAAAAGIKLQIQGGG